MEASLQLIYDGHDVEGRPKLSLSRGTLDVTGLSLKNGEILLRLLISTICGSDLHTISGRRKEKTPIVLGHEGVGLVVKSSRNGVEPGDRLTFSIADSCGQCCLCIAGVPQKCPLLLKYGHTQVLPDVQFTGCYSSFILLRSGTTVVNVPPSIPDSVASTINCALATSVNAVSNIPENSNFRTFLVQGAGLLGLYCCALLSCRTDCDAVFCTDVSDERLATVSKFGATTSIEAKVVDRAIKPNSVDAVIEVCGEPAAVSAALRLVRPGGLIILVGLVHPDSALDLTGEQIIRKCVTIIGVHNYGPVHLRDATAFLAELIDRFPFTSLISEPYRLDKYEEAFDIAKKGRYHRVAFQL